MAAEPRSAAVDRIAAEIDADLIALRRDIHRWPELAGHEERTAGLVAQRLRAAGLTVTTGVGGHGVVGVLDGAGPGRTIAYRADMDAVDGRRDAAEPPGELASQVSGAAHLCGHDLHTTIGVGIAQLLARLRERFAGRVALLFQPAEEDLTGAQAMIDAGVLDRVAPQEIYALHCGPQPAGALAVLPGAGLPGLDTGHIAVSGPAADQVARELAAEIERLSTVEYPRTPDELAQLMHDAETPDGPLARFVFAQPFATGAGDGTARVEFGLRAWPDDRYPELRDELRRLAAGHGNAHIEFRPEPFPAMVCSPELSLAAADHLAAMSDVEVAVVRAPTPFNGEDFALFLRRVPGAMFYLGVANPTDAMSGVAHSPGFVPDERAIGLGVRAMAMLLLDRLGVDDRAATTTG